MGAVRAKHEIFSAKHQAIVVKIQEMFLLLLLICCVSGNPRMIQSALKGDLDSIIKHILTGSVPDNLTMIAACRSGNINLVTFLINKCKKLPGSLCLDAAVESNTLNLVQFLVEGGFVIPNERTLNISQRSFCKKEISIYIAARMGRLDHVKKYKKKPEIRDLRAAASSGNLDLVKYLFKYFQKRTDYVILVLHDAISSGNLDVVRYLIHDLHFAPDINSLNLACRHGYYEISKAIMDEIIPDQTTLSYAIDGGDWKLVKYLIFERFVWPDLNQANQIRIKYY